MTTSALSTAKLHPSSVLDWIIL